MTALASNWLIHLAQALWQATLAGALILLIVRLGRGWSPRLRHALVSLALVKFMIPPMLAMPTGVFSAMPPVPWRDPANLNVIVMLMLVHLAGIAVALTRLAIGAWRLRRIVRAAEPMDGYLLSDDVPVPMTTGRAIVIPRALHARLTEDELEHVLAHEREHQRRRDVRTGVLHALVAAVWWFHPLVHLLVREARTLREERCDDAVLGRGYAAALLRVATLTAGRVPEPAAAIGESAHTLLRRVRRMADAPPRPFGRAAVVFIVLAALVLLPGARVAGVSFRIHQHHH